MKILCSNPDTIGDMVLRQPMYRALRESGHELTLIVRPSVAPLVPYVAPGAATLILPTEVYRDDLESQWESFERLFRAAREGRPDALLVAPYQWTRFEERLADELKDLKVRRFGMSGRLYAGDPHAGYAPPSRLTFDVTAQVQKDEPEIEKNAALAAAVLGRPDPVEPREPRIEPDAPVLEDARRILAELGLLPGGYWIGGVTGTIHVPIKSWQLENWAKLLSHWVRNYDRRFLLIGLPEERRIVDDVRGMMGDAADHTIARMDGGSSLPQLIGLIAHAGGYAGHDTGPMHLAAALGKPVFAVFGGGHKQRFYPRGAAGAPSVALTVGVPCAGCAWNCPFETSHCVKAVPVEDAICAADDLEAGRITGCEARVLAPGDELRDRMIREAAAFAKDQLRESGERGRQLREQIELTIRPMQAALEAQASTADALTATLAEREAANADLRASVDRLTGESDALIVQLKQKEKEAAELAAELSTRTRDAAESRRALTAREAAADRLSAQVRELELALAKASAALTWSPRRRTLFPGRRISWRQLATELITGRNEYVPRGGPRALPKIALVTPVPARLPCGCRDCRAGEGAPECEPGESCRAADLASVRQTIESVLAQDYPRLEYIIVPVVTAAESDGNALDWLRQYEGRLTVAMPADAPFAAIAQAFGSTDADVIGWLEAGDLLEPRAMWNVGTFFRDHPRAAAAVFDDTTEIAGWRVPASPPPRFDVYSLLQETDRPILASVFVRRGPYRSLGSLDRSRGPAAGWHLWLRFARRHGFARPGAHVACRRPQPKGSVLAPLPLWPTPAQASGAQTTARQPDVLAEWRAAATAARTSFEAAFGLAGQIRCRLVHMSCRLRDTIAPVLRRNRLSFISWRTDSAVAEAALSTNSAGLHGSKLENVSRSGLACEARAALDDGAETAVHALQAGPLNENVRTHYPDSAGIMPQECSRVGNSAFRLLFRVPIASNLYGRAVYHAPKAGLAFSMEGGVTAGTVLAKVPQDETTLQMSDRTIDIACAPAVWPFTDALQAPLWERPILEIPCPWRAHQTNPANMVPPRLVSVLKRIVRSDDREVAFLHAGCGDGILLGQLRPIVRWALAGIEPDAQAGSVARGKGFEIWDTEVTDAPLILPVGRSFDVIFLDPAAVRVAGLLTTLRRLRQLLKPGGSLVVTGVNLDSRLLELFGPTWHGWQVAWSMPLAGRRGMAHQAAQADLRLARFRTFTDPALTSSAVQQHRLKLVATPAPEAPSKPDKDRADNLCGWARLLWNWRGKGDTYYAVLQP